MIRSLFSLLGLCVLLAAPTTTFAAEGEAESATQSTAEGGSTTTAPPPSDAPPPASDAPAPATEAPPPPEAAAEAPMDLSFDDEPTIAPEEAKRIQESLRLRKKLVPVHQTLAITAAISIVTAEVIGIGNRVALMTGKPENFTRNPGLDRALWAHRLAAGTALTTYLGAGLVAWTMPRAYTRPVSLMAGGKAKPDSSKVHRALSIGHGIAMGSVFVTGFLQANVLKTEHWEPVVVAHGISGFTAAALVLTSALVIGTF